MSSCIPLGQHTGDEFQLGVDANQGWRVAVGPEVGDGGEGESWLIEVELVRAGELVGEVEVELVWADGSTERRAWDGAARWKKWQLESPHRLREVIVDPDGDWALETRRADNYWRDEPRRPGHPLWWLRDLGRLLGSIVLRLG